MSILSESYALAFILVILFLTDALPEYLRLCGFGQIKKLSLKEYFNEKATTAAYFPENYLEYLNLKYNHFLLKLCSCPFCISFYFALLFGFSCGLLQIMQIYIESLLMFFIIKYLSKSV
jgi:hypothetical protein